MVTDAQKQLFKMVKLNKTTSEEIEKVLYDSHLPIDITNGWNETLIYNCCKHAVNIPILEWLSTSGCNPFIVNKKGFNCVDACMKWNHKKGSNLVLDWLHSKQLQGTITNHKYPYVHNMIIYNGTESSLPWISKHYDINKQEPVYGYTPIHISVHQDTDHNSPAPCEWLCANALPDIQDKNGQSALHLACFNGFRNCVSMILRTGKWDITLKDKNNRTPREVAEHEQLLNNPRKWPSDWSGCITLLCT